MPSDRTLGVRPVERLTPARNADTSIASKLKCITFPSMPMTGELTMVFSSVETVDVVGRVKEGS